MRPQSLQYLFQCVRGMGVIDNHLYVQRIRYHLHASRNRLQTCRRSQYGPQIFSPQHQCSDRGGKICQIKVARKRAKERRVAPRGMQFTTHAIAVKLSIFNTHIGGRTTGRIGQHLDIPCHSGFYRHAKWVIHIDDGMTQPLNRKQPLFGATISRHTAVVVEVIVGQIGIDRGFERDAVNSTLLQCMGGDFHTDCKYILLEPLCQLSLQR